MLLLLALPLFSSPPSPGTALLAALNNPSIHRSAATQTQQDKQQQIQYYNVHIYIYTYYIRTYSFR